MKRCVFFVSILLLTFSCRSNNDEEKLVQSFKEFVNELILQRKEYVAKLSEIKISQIDGNKAATNIDQLEKIKFAISQQRSIDSWNFEETKALYSKSVSYTHLNRF